MNITENKQKIIDAFSSVSRDIVAQMTNITVEAGKSNEKERFYSSYDYSFFVGVSGKYKGAISMSMSEETALSIASAMMGNVPVQQLNEMSESALLELVNMTAARALMEIVENEPFNLSPPAFIKGKDIRFSVADIQKTLAVTLNTEKGVVEFNISLSDKE